MTPVSAWPGNTALPVTWRHMCFSAGRLPSALQWRHNERDSVSNHQPHDCLFNYLFRRRSKKTSKVRVTGLCGWNSPVTGETLHKGPVTRKMFPFDDVIMTTQYELVLLTHWGLNKTVEILHITFSMAFSLIQILESHKMNRCNMFLRASITFGIGSGNGLSPNRRRLANT